MMPTLENPKLGAIVPKKHTSSRSGQLRPDNPIARVDQHSHTSRAEYQLAQELQPFRRYLDVQKIDAGQAGARPDELGDKTKPDRVFADGERRANQR